MLIVKLLVIALIATGNLLILDFQGNKHFGKSSFRTERGGKVGGKLTDISSLSAWAKSAGSDAHVFVGVACEAQAL